MKSLNLITNPIVALRVFLIGLISLIALPSAMAAASGPEIEKLPLPAGPLLNKMPNPSAWKISYSYDSEKTNSVTGKVGTPPPAPNGSELQDAIRSITVSRRGGDWVAITEDVKGHRLEQCSAGGAVFSSDPRRPSITMLITPDEIAQIPSVAKTFNGGIFPDLEWITPASYLGVQKFQDVDYLVFGKEDGTKAWVNAKTRFPSQVKTSNGVVIFQRLPDPTMSLELPEGARNLLRAINLDRAIFNKPRPPGG